MVFLALGLLIFSIFILYVGAELTLDSSEKIGESIGLSPLVIGLVIVGFGTSLPEFFVSQLACLRGHSDMALGNLIGSNLANTLLVLGVAGILTPLFLSQKEVIKQLALHSILYLILLIFLVKGPVSVVFSAILFIFFGVYILTTLQQMVSEHKIHKPTKSTHPGLKAKFVLGGKLVGGLGLLYGGGELLVYSGSDLGRLLGISEYVISAVFVAFGTSFPELVTALLACIRKKNTDLITGNIIGSNIFNLGMVLASLGPYRIMINQDFRPEIAVLLAAALILLILGLVKRPFYRIAGGLFLASYIGIVVYWSQN